MDTALQDEAVELTRDLVRIPSENPTGTEARVAERLEDYLLRLGLPVERDRVGGGPGDMGGAPAAALGPLRAQRGKIARGAPPRRTVRCCMVVDEESPWMR